MSEVVPVDLVFDLGSAEEAKGHTLVYFRDSRAPNNVLASYVIVLPLSFDLSKYVPPLLASRIPQVNAEAASFIPLPPIPEAFDSFDALKRLANLRGDDLVFGGDVDPTMMESSLVALNEAAQTYAKLYQERLSGETEPKQDDEMSVKEVLYSLMGEKDKLSELAKLTGKLRYAVEGNDRVLAAETVVEMEILGRLLPEKYKVKDLIRVAQLTEGRGSKLAELFLDRCYKISNEQYGEIEQIDRSIGELDRAG